LNALEAIIATEGKLPVNLMSWPTVKKSGSPHFSEIVDQYEERLRSCVGVFFP